MGVGVDGGDGLRVRCEWSDCDGLLEGCSLLPQAAAVCKFCNFTVFLFFFACVAAAMSGWIAG